jgi:hypothetical protein
MRANSRCVNVPRRSGQDRRDRPDRRGAGDDANTADPFGEPSDGKSQKGVDHREAGALQQPQLQVGEPQVLLHRLRHGGEHRPVGEVEGRHREHQDQESGLVAAAQQIGA